MSNASKTTEATASQTIEELSAARARVQELIDKFTKASLDRHLAEEDSYDESLVNEELQLGHVLAGAIRQAAGLGATWGWGSFRDERTRLRWFATPLGLRTDGRPYDGKRFSLVMMSGGRTWTSVADTLVIVRPGERVLLSTTTLKAEHPDVMLEAGLDGTVVVVSVDPPDFGDEGEAGYEVDGH